MRWEVEVVELRAVRVAYTVEAEDAGGAMRAAEMGDTVSEVDVCLEGIRDRHVVGSPEEVK